MTKTILALAGALALGACAHENGYAVSTSQTNEGAFDQAYDAVKTGAKKTAQAGEWLVEKTEEGAIKVYRWGKQEVAGTSEHPSDSFITAQVKARLATDGSVSSKNIHVTTDAGVVTLRGTVSSSREASRAIEDALDVKGVQTINDELFLQPASR